MKKWIGVSLAAVIVAVAGSLSYAAADGQGEKKLIVGEVIELSTFAMQGHGEEHAAATKLRLEQGFPAGILEEETGEVWIAVYKNPAPASGLECANTHLAPYAGKKVVASGLAYEKGGVKVIRMSLVSEY